MPTCRPRGNIKIAYNQGVIGIDAKPNGTGFWLTLKNGQTLDCEKLLIAAGSLRSSKAAAISRELGHSVQQLVPSLFTFHIQDSRLRGLAGISVDDAELFIPELNLKSRGPLLITHWGLSGPAVLRLSAWGARQIHEKNYQFKLRVNWLPSKNDSRQPVTLAELKKTHPRRKVCSANALPLPGRLWERLTQAARIPDSALWATLSKEKQTALDAQIAQAHFEVNGKSMHKEEFVTCGGITLKEIDFRTMESKVCPGLYYAGESLDIDGITGGFNFQAAWTTGRIAGEAMGQKLLARI